MSKQASSIPSVDLVIVIDTSPSMKDEARSLSDAASSAIAKAKSSCPSDLRVVWLGIEGTWKGTSFDQTVRAYLTQKCKVSESKLRGRKKGEVADAGAQEDAARAIEDISDYFDWRTGAARAIFYLGDEALEGGGDKTDREDIKATNLAIQKAQGAGITVHTYFGTSKSKHSEGIKTEYARLATSTGGQAFTDKDAISGFSAVLEKVICGSRTAKPVKLAPGAVYIQDCVSNEFSKLYTLDLATGKASLIGEIVTEVSDIAFVGSQLYGLDREGDKTQLIKIDLNSGNATVIGNIGFAAAGLTYSRYRRTLYATTAKQLIAINLETGKGTPIATVAGKDYNCGEVAFDANGKAYITLIGYDKKKLLASCNLDTGEVKNIGDIGFPDLASMEFVGDVLYGVTGNFYKLGKDGQLIRIDTTTGRGTLVTSTDPAGRWAGITIYEPVKVVTTEITPGVSTNEESGKTNEESGKTKVTEENKVVREESMNLLTIDTKNNCYVIDANQMNNLQQHVASSFTFDKGTFDIKITGGRYSYAKAKTEGEPFVLLWIYGVDGSTFINKNTGFEVGATWTTLNGYSDRLKLEVKERAVLCALFFDLNNTDNSGTIDLLITSNKPFFNPHTLKVDSKRNCYVLDESHLSSLKQSGSNVVELNPGNYRIKIREGNASYWSDNKKFNIEPWALIWVQGGKFVTKLTGIEVAETWCSLNGLKDEVIIEVKEKTTLTGLFFDTFKEDNEGQIVLAIEPVSVTELTKISENREKISVQERTKETTVTTETVTTFEGSGGSGSRERETVTAGNSIEFTFRFNEDEFKKKWEEQLQQIDKSLKGLDEKDVTLEAKYWDQLEHWLLKNYEKHFKNLAVEVAKVRFTMDAYTQQMEFSLNQHLQGWSTYLDRLLQDRINVEISKRINQQINQYFDQTFEQKIRNNVGLIINNIINKQELNQYIDRYVERQLDQSFEQKVQNNVALIVNNIVNRQELNQHIDQHIDRQVNQTFEQKVRNNIELIVNNIVNKQEFNQHINQHVDSQVNQTFEQKVRNNIELIVNNIVTKQEFNQHIDQHVDSQVNQTFEQKVRNNIELIVNNIVTKQEFNQHIDQHVDTQIEQTFEQKVHNHINAITQALVTNNTELNQYVNQQIDNTYEQKIQNNLSLITHNIVNNNQELNQYIEHRLQETVINNTEVNNEIVNLVSNSTEINEKIENLRSEWNQTFINLVTQNADILINTIGGKETFNQLINQKIVNNNTEINEYISLQIDNTYEQKIQNNLSLITHNIVNNNQELNQYIDNRLQETVINNTEINNEIINLVSNSTEINNKIENLRNEWNQTFISLATQHIDSLINTIGGKETFNQLIIQKIVNNNTAIDQYISQQIDNTYEQKIQNNLQLITHNIVNNNEELNQYIDNRLQQIVVNNTEINNKLENLRNEWNQTFINLATQHIDRLISIIGNRETFNQLITQKIVNNNTDIDQYISLQIDNTYEQKVRNYIQLITHNIVNNNQELNQYIDNRLQQTVLNNTEINYEIINLISNSTEINTKIENLRNEWNQAFINLATQHIEQLISIIGNKDTFNQLLVQKIVNNNTEINQYISQQIDNTYEQKVRNYIQVITQNIVNNNEELNQYFDQRLQQTVISNTNINNQIVNFVANSTEINNKINNVYRDIDIKIANVRNEWNQSFISLVGQYVDEIINIIGNRDTFNIRIANLINVKVDELLNQILRTKNELTVIMNNADRHLYEWTLGELMAIKGCLTDRQAFVEHLVSFSTELRTKLDCAPCVDINTIKPFKPLSSTQPQQLPGS
ncbi:MULTISPECIES: hypothetical protein [Nostocales]|uniref:VWFA domain-containing protein n=3 Tax=Nostocales TaxID=1161 RepID=A0A8S9T849_9CYAN|nr:hypothetical protein [Tolypothrix bouteillei]KAF3888575.1 hypothetical protein DA73_0400026180 [Tolypothrix bouteillei VB521301]